MTSENPQTGNANRAGAGVPWRNVARGTLVAAYVVVAAELFVRFFHPVPLFPRNVVATPYGIRGNKPNAKYRHTSPDVRVEFRINAKGIRADREFSYEKPGGVVRIVALGDSFGMGYEVELEDTFLNKMEQGLRRRGIAAEVINLSVSGHGTTEELIALRAEGFRYDPDLVLVCWHYTDLEDNLRTGLFALRGEELAQTGTSYLPGVHIREKLERVALYTWAEENSQLYGWAREAAAGAVKSLLLPSRSPEPEEKPRATEPGKAGTSAGPRPLSPPEELAIALLRKIQSEAAARGAKVLVLDIPDRIGRTDFRSDFPKDPEGKNFGLAVVSPIPRFRAERRGLLYNERSHWHFTPLATGVVGELLAEEIVGSGMLAADPHAPETTPPPPDR